MAACFSFPFFAMGTECLLHLYARNASQADRAAQRAIDEVARIEQRYSRFRGDSLLAEINRAAQAGATLEVDEETAGLLDYAYACHAKSAGKFDITSGILYDAWDFSTHELPEPSRVAMLLPRVGLEKIRWQRPVLQFPQPGMKLDFGGIGKEYAADRVADLCLGAGIAHGLVDLGGDIRVIGPHPHGAPWHIGIRDPAQPENALAVIAVRSGAIASSGDYERHIEVAGKRYSHLLDPASGWPVHGLAAVSVVAERCLVAGSLSTIAMLKGRDGIAWLDSLGVDYLWVDDQGKRGGTLSAAPTGR
ncbi:MAG: FAD:protein FMN transferase [Sulfuricella sp.]|nr:FAD:protein FMN transferase [Sulfuricella sp.]